MGLEDKWHKNETIYSVDVETFYDSDGDGVGDFQGLIDRLGYLSRLGVSCLWLLPFYETPNLDNGYDVADYYQVDSRLGNMGDFVEFTHEARARGIRVIVDLVVNHTSDQHPWFQAARRDPDSPYRDYYVWTDEPAAAPDKETFFPGEEEDVWAYDEVAEAYYYHRFYRFQPDLNLRNPDVREEIRKILGFWLELGVSGFRVDAATLMIDQKGTLPPLDDPHSVLKEMKSFVRSRRGDAILLAEADDAPDELDEYFGDDGDEMDLLLNFVLNAHLTPALAREEAEPLVSGLERLPDVSETPGQWANFLRNHDELNVGRLSDAARAEVFETFGPDERMRIYGRGLRRRLAPMLGGDPERIELAYSLLFALPGTPVIVSGDEIGMGEDLSLPGRNAVRTPLHWSDDPNAGFSSGDPDSLVRSVIAEGPFGYEHVNVAAQRADQDSLLDWMERLIGTRKECPSLGWGTQTVLDTGSGAVFANRYDWEENTVVTAHNLAAEGTTVTLDLGDPDGSIHRLVGEGEHDRREDGSVDVDLGRYDYCWLRVGEEHAARRW
jgi:maltose alpha-D-glucosyltransferase/alpha-amylase